MLEAWGGRRYAGAKLTALYAPFMPPRHNSYRSFTAISAISRAVEGARVMGDLIYLALGVVLFGAFGAYAWLLRGL
jgi:hypothetical protein